MVTTLLHEAIEHVFTGQYIDRQVLHLLIFCGILCIIYVFQYTYIYASLIK